MHFPALVVDQGLTNQLQHSSHSEATHTSPIQILCMGLIVLGMVAKAVLAVENLDWLDCMYFFPTYWDECSLTEFHRFCSLRFGMYDDGRIFEVSKAHADCRLVSGIRDDDQLLMLFCEFGVGWILVFVLALMLVKRDMRYEHSMVWVGSGVLLAFGPMAMVEWGGLYWTGRTFTIFSLAQRGSWVHEWTNLSLMVEHHIDWSAILFLRLFSIFQLSGNPESRLNAMAEDSLERGGRGVILDLLHHCIWLLLSR